ncbi:MbtH family protein [Nocardia sp. NPDC051570]|uniref:MbtH family protein n=1 Tax=Nocardia sp. NPDC051570 TaxID=3364324 RepID=UPI0037992DFE
MTNTEERWVVVVNDEEQYSIWFANRDIPAGWRSVEVEGSKDECLSHIERVWTDMRPKSLREKLRNRSELLRDRNAPTPIGSETR